MVCGISVDRSETASTEYRQIEFHRRYICFHSVDLSTSYKVGWLVVLGLNDSLRQYFRLYRVVSQREGEREEKG